MPEKLYRSDDEVYLRNFVEEGEIFFRPLQYFRQVEDNVGRRDELEGKYSRNAAGLIVQTDLEGSGHFGTVMKFERGNFVWETKHPDQIHIYCFSHRRQTIFGSAAVEIFDAPGFLLHLELGLRSVNAELMHGFIEYYDASDRMEAGIPTDLWLKKPKIFANQYEFRIAFFVENRRDFYCRSFPEIYGGHDVPIPENIKMRIGNIEKFARILP